MLEQALTKPPEHITRLASLTSNRLAVVAERRCGKTTLAMARYFYLNENFDQNSPVFLVVPTTHRLHQILDLNRQIQAFDTEATFQVITVNDVVFGSLPKSANFVYDDASFAITIGHANDWDRLRPNSITLIGNPGLMVPNSFPSWDAYRLRWSTVAYASTSQTFTALT